MENLNIGLQEQWKQYVKACYSVLRKNHWWTIKTTTNNNMATQTKLKNRMLTKPGNAPKNHLPLQNTLNLQTDLNYSSSATYGKQKD